MLFQRYALSFIIFVFLICLRCESKHNLKKHVRSKTNFNGKVVGGTPVPIDKFPYAVQFINAHSFCGGVIIHSWAIITAAHCITKNPNKNEMIIQAGARYLYDFRGDSYRVLHYVVHEEYQKETPFSCDIALVFPTTPFKFGRTVKKAILVDHDKWMDEEADPFTVIGWGLTETKGEPSKVGLQMVLLRYVSERQCSRLHINHTFTEDMFCLYGGGKQDSCKGDSGGGVIWNDMVVGITSYGNGCARKNKPTVYTNVWFMKDWINNTLTGFYSSYCEWKFPTMETVSNNNVKDSLEIFI